MITSRLGGGGRRMALVLVVASVTMTACLGNNGSPQAGTETATTDHSTVSTSPTSPTTSLAPDSPTGAGAPTTAGPGTFGTVSPPTTRPAPETAATTAPTTTPTTASTTTTTSLPPGNTPVIASVSPSSGRAGQAVTLSGSRLFSANGAITVLFGQTATGVSCQTQSVCRATVPVQPNPGTTAVGVTITTDAGTSKPVTFTYR